MIMNYKHTLCVCRLEGEKKKEKIVAGVGFEPTPSK